jgi:O-antigen/teichoic acid export membrane protein
VVAYIYRTDIGWLVLAGLAAKLVETSLLFLLCRRSLGLTGPKALRRPIARRLLGLGGWITLSSVLGPVLENSDRFVIGAMVGANAVAAYAIAYNLITRLSLLPLSLARALYPRLLQRSAMKPTTSR